MKRSSHVNNWIDKYVCGTQSTGYHKNKLSICPHNSDVLILRKHECRGTSQPLYQKNLRRPVKTVCVHQPSLFPTRLDHHRPLLLHHRHLPSLRVGRAAEKTQTAAPSLQSFGRVNTPENSRQQRRAC